MVGLLVGTHHSEGNGCLLRGDEESEGTKEKGTSKNRGGNVCREREAPRDHYVVCLLFSATREFKAIAIGLIYIIR